ncbi:MAG: endo-1,4-beta-xylanase [Prevotellaceae bacterium]|jgi:endo-1,4-beta-xylanase|nr:endo-1,4-beta-xylanase [Prevotellaceae bacterium]
MKNIILTTLIIGLLTACGAKQQPPQTLKSALAGDFYIGTAVNLEQIFGRDTAGVDIIKTQFNAIVAENCMKSMFIQPEQGKFFFDEADKFVEFGKNNGMWITGHCLVWHNQMPAWFLVDKNGEQVSRDTLLARIKTHITTVVSRYKGQIKGWDVVNEAIMEDGSWRQSPLYSIAGESFIDSAFVWAHAADPDAELYYNDYAMAHQGKRNGVVALVNHLKQNEIRIDAVGMQGHAGIDHPDFAEFERSINAFAATGAKVMITELDISILPTPNRNIGADITAQFEYQQQMNPYPEGLPEDVDSAWNARVTEFFALFIKHKDAITRVTTWGTTDNDTWRNDWPIPGRKDYPLLFDRNYKPKPCVEKIIESAN